MVLTPANLQALLRMMQCKIRRGPDCCIALCILQLWTTDMAVWRMPLPDGSTFSLKCLEVLCQGLEDDLEHFRACKNNRWQQEKPPLPSAATWLALPV